MRRTISPDARQGHGCSSISKYALYGDVPGPIQAAIVQAVNGVLDAHASRISVINDRIPAAVFILLMFIAAASLAVAGHNAGLDGTLNRWRMSAFSLVLAALMLMVVDFDRGKHGFIQTTPKPSNPYALCLNGRNVA